MNEVEFKSRTKKLALRVIRLVEALPNTKTAGVIGKQFLRCETSVGANYRAACRGKSIPDVLNKLAIVEEEADESLCGLEIIEESKLIPENRLLELKAEFNEILAMIVASIKDFTFKTNPKSKIQNSKLI